LKSYVIILKIEIMIKSNLWEK